jgi:hypothetical protein
MSGRDWRRTEISRRDNRPSNFDKVKVVRSSSGKATVKADFSRKYASKYVFSNVKPVALPAYALNEESK